ncbi:hypothetical protein [Kitasatospora sp. DSM 101779]|uniref:hypothetical protein n=1 Tax=Kitasatospora sp. DSM 101779 TaxID=2853165 RepID=UPI0021DA5021|nr:hypothetical protein [Kitasatospora sp. DSM 101779]
MIPLLHTTHIAGAAPGIDFLRLRGEADQDAAPPISGSPSTTPCGACPHRTSCSSTAASSPSAPRPA